MVEKLGRSNNSGGSIKRTLEQIEEISLGGSKVQKVSTDSSSSMCSSQNTVDSILPNVSTKDSEISEGINKQDFEALQTESHKSLQDHV